MKVRKKFQKENIYINPYTFKLTKDSVENFEQIADDYAIKFAEWIIDIDKKPKCEFKITELLEKFKKEK